MGNKPGPPALQTDSLPFEPAQKSMYVYIHIHVYTYIYTIKSLSAVHWKFAVDQLYLINR